MVILLTQGGNMSQKWKKRLAAKARKMEWEAPGKLLVPRPPTLAGGGDQADKFYLHGGNIDISKGGSESPRRRQWVPNQKDRVGVRRIRLGLSAVVCGHPGVAAPNCPCTGGQTPVHNVMWRRISGLTPHDHLVPHHSAHQGRPVRYRARGGGLGLRGGRSKTAGMGHQQKAMHTLRSREDFSPNAEAGARATATAIWWTGMEAASRRLTPLGLA